MYQIGFSSVCVPTNYEWFALLKPLVILGELGEADSSSEVVDPLSQVMASVGIVFVHLLPVCNHVSCGVYTADSMYQLVLRPESVLIEKKRSPDYPIE